MRKAILVLSGLLAGAAHAADSPVTPGKWQTTTTILSMAMPGMPPGVLKSMQAKPTTLTICITPQQAAAGPRDMISQSNGACRYRSFSAVGGRINAVMACNAGQAGPQTIAISGSYSTAAYDITSKMRGGAMQSSARTVGKRLGPC